jgi:putative SOS response-associated peptidase YedK
MARVMRAAGEGVVELAPMRFGFPPLRPKASPVFNFRSEGRRFGALRQAQGQRCLVPASAFFEFTGTTYPKAKHRFALNDAPFLAIALLWRDGQGNQPPRFAMLTTAPGPDAAPIHNRQVVVRRPADWMAGSISRGLKRNCCARCRRARCSSRPCGRLPISACSNSGAAPS